MTIGLDPVLSAAMALASAALLLAHEQRAASAPESTIPGAPRLAPGPWSAWLALAPLLVLAPLAAMVAAAPRALPQWTAFAVGLVVAILARMRRDLLHSECAVKLLWVMGGALALSWAGLQLLVLATGTTFQVEQWAVLELGLEPRFLWSTALPLSLLVGVVLLGGAPFHFWAADLLQGARPWLAPLAVAALQVCGGAWLITRLAGIEAFPAGAQVIEVLLGIATLLAFLVGAATLAAQRRPERRVGTLASMNGALILATLVTARHAEFARELPADLMGAWAGHLVLALSGAGTLARFLPVSSAVAAGGPVLFRRHRMSGLVGLFSLFSLAGVPGTPGSWLWLAVARALARTGQTWLLVALAVAWLAAFSTAVRQLREAFGVRTERAPATEPVPWQARAAMWATAAALAVMGYGGWLR